MARLVTLSPFGAETIAVLLDEDQVFSLPNVNPPAPIGTTYEIFDNLGLGLDVNITGPFADGGSVTVSGVAGWMMRFVWIGSFYAVGA